MGLCNWDLLAFNEDGERDEDGVLLGFEGGACYIRKNWVYVGDPRMWRSGLRYSEPVIARIDEGVVHLSEFSIRAARGPLESVFVDARCSSGDTVRRLAGIGCWGYTEAEEPERWVGIQPETVEAFLAWLDEGLGDEYDREENPEKVAWVEKVKAAAKEVRK